jgi:hypothetical protein
MFVDLVAAEQEMHAVLSWEHSKQKTASETRSKWEACITNCMEEMHCENMNSTGQSKVVAVLNVGWYLRVGTHL